MVDFDDVLDAADDVDEIQYSDVEDEVDGPSVDEVKDVALPGEVNSQLRDYAVALLGEHGEETSKTWLSGIKIHGKYLALEHQIAPLEASRPQVKRYFRWVAQTRYAANTKSNYLSACSQFYEWAEDSGRGENVIPHYDSGDVSFDAGDLDEDDREIAGEDNYDYISPEEVRQLWHPDNLPSPRTRNELIFKILWYTGMRCRALANLRADDVLMDEGKMVIDNLKAPDTAPDYRSVVYPRDKLNPLIREWVERKRSRLGPYHEESEYLLLSHQAESLDPSYISRLVKETAKEAGINEIKGHDVNGEPQWKVRGHTIRHSAATHWANSCPDISITHIKNQLGHRKLSSTRRYIGDHLPSRRKAFNSAWE